MGITGGTAEPSGVVVRHQRRDSYVPTVPSEFFIVPLLRHWIETHLREFTRPGGRMLDVGCGEQPFRELISTLEMTYEGLDLQQNAAGTVDIIASIERPLRISHPAIGEYDLVLCSEVLEHVADWGPAFANLAELTAPGGTLLVTCPHIYPPHEEPTDFWRPTPNALRYFAERNGLMVIAVSTAGAGWGTLGTVLAGTFSAPATRALFDRGLSRITNKFLGVMRAISRSRRFRKKLLVTTSMPLVTLGIFQKA